MKMQMPYQGMAELPLRLSLLQRLMIQSSLQAAVIMDLQSERSSWQRAHSQQLQYLHLKWCLIQLLWQQWLEQLPQMKGLQQVQYSFLLLHQCYSPLPPLRWARFLQTLKRPSLLFQMLHNSVRGPNTERFNQQRQWLNMLDCYANLWLFLVTDSWISHITSLYLTVITTSWVPLLSLFDTFIIRNFQDSHSFSTQLQILMISRSPDAIRHRTRSLIWKVMRLILDGHSNRPTDGSLVNLIATVSNPCMSLLRQARVQECKLLTISMEYLAAMPSYLSISLDLTPLSSWKSSQLCMKQLFLARSLSSALMLRYSSAISWSSPSLTSFSTSTKNLPSSNFSVSMQCQKQLGVENLFQSQSHHLVKILNICGLYILRLWDSIQFQVKGRAESGSFLPILQEVYSCTFSLYFSLSFYWILMSSFLNCSSEMEYFLWMASRLSLDQYSSSMGFSCSASFIQSQSSTASNILSIFSQNFWQTVLLPTLNSIFLSISLMSRMMRSLYSPLSLNLKDMAELKRQSLSGWSVLSISLMELLTFLLTSWDCVMGYLAIQYSSNFCCSCTLIIQKCLGVRWCRSESLTMLRRIYWLLYILQYQQLN